MRSYGALMRGWTKSVVVLLTLVGAALAGCGEERPPLTAQQCRQAWDDLRQTEGENGSIAPDGTATSSRWQQEYDGAARRAKDPGDPGSCADDVAAARRRFSRLVDLGSAIQEHDLAEQLARAERDLAHARELGGFAELPPRLADAFDRLRSAAPAVHEAVATAEAKAAEVDLADGGAVEDLVVEIEEAATGDPSYAEGRRALEVIGRYELHEE
jgi:hypothetical protein